MRLVTDPILRRRVAHLRRSGPPPRSVPVADAVLISHVHWDHLDLPSLERVGRETTIVVPAGAGRLLDRRGFGRVIEVEPGSQIELGPVNVLVTKAEHLARRRPWGRRPPAVGYLVTGPSRLYFAGDTDLFPEMAALAPVDVAFLPISGWGSRVGRGHLDARRAVEALRAVRARFAVPIHWGTYEPVALARLRHADDRPALDTFIELARELAPASCVVPLLPGQSAELREEPSEMLRLPLGRREESPG